MMVDVHLTFDPFTGTWNITRSDQEVEAVASQLQATKI